MTDQASQEGTEQYRPVLTFSLLSMFRSCPRKFFFRYVRSKVPFREDPKLGLGKVVHKALERWYEFHKTGLLKEPTPSREETIEQILHEIDMAFPERVVAGTMDKKNWHIAKALFLAYIEKYPGESFKNVVAVEPRFRHRIVNPDTGRKSRSFDLAGKGDLVIEEQDDALWLWDHKTAARVDGGYLKRLELDLQVQIYRKNLAEEFGRPIQGVIWNVLEKPMLKQRQGESEFEYEARKAALIAKSKTGKSSAKQKMPESDEDFHGRLMDWYREEDRFIRHQVILTEAEELATDRDVWDLVKRILLCQRTGHWGRNTDMCFHWNKPCMYWPICSSHDNEMVVENEFTDASPTRELDEAEEEDEDDIPF